MTSSAPWERPEELETGLAILEVHWREKQNPVYIWRAIELCLQWTDASGEFAGPFQFPNWVLLYLLRASSEIMRLAGKFPSPGNKVAGPDILTVLGFASQGRQVFQQWVTDAKQTALAGMVDASRPLRGKLTEAYQRLATEPKQLPIRPRRGKAELDDPRPIARIVTEGRRRLDRIAKAVAEVPKLPT